MSTASTFGNGTAIDNVRSGGKDQQATASTNISNSNSNSRSSGSVNAVDLVKKVDRLSFDLKEPSVKLNVQFFIRLIRFIRSLMSTSSSLRRRERLELPSIVVDHVTISPLSMRVSFATANPVKSAVLSTYNMRSCATDFFAFLKPKKARAQSQQHANMLQGENDSTASEDMEQQESEGAPDGTAPGSSGEEEKKQPQTAKVLKVAPRSSKFAVSSMQRHRSDVLSELVYCIGNHFLNELTVQQDRLHSLLGWLEWANSVELAEEIDELLGHSRSSH